MTPTEQDNELREAIHSALFADDFPILNDIEKDAVDRVVAIILADRKKQTNEAIHGFHGFVMEADIIRPEADQAFNYGRLHRAIDDYIAERNKFNNSDGDVK